MGRAWPQEASTTTTSGFGIPTIGQEVMRLHGHKSEILSVAFSPDGSRLASTSIDGTVRIWNATTVSPERINQRLAHDWVQLHYDPQGRVEGKL